jgi:hypothetical protein
VAVKTMDPPGTPSTCGTDYAGEPMAQILGSSAHWDLVNELTMP